VTTTRHNFVVFFVSLSMALVSLCAASDFLPPSDAVTQWNSAMLDAIRAQTTPPCLAARNLAVMHVAIYDAVNAIDRTHEPYRFRCDAQKEASVEAAAISAAHRVATTLFPSHTSRFDSLRTNLLASLPEGSPKENGLILGRQAADAILTWRRADGSSTLETYIPRDGPGEWRRTPPFFRPPELTHWGKVTPFAMTNASQFRPPAPPALCSRAYEEDVNEVKRLGGANSTERTAAQTRIAQFWSDFSYTMTPPGHWNVIAQDVAKQKKLSLAENARLFALLNIALADAAIVAWDAKYSYNRWRPFTAIRQADLDGNSDTEKDPEWKSLLITPAFPEYISGHSTFSGAAAAVLTEFFGTDAVHFEVTSDSMPGVVRSYDSFAEAAAEIGRSRIYGGIHFRSADVEGRKAGTALGRYVVERFLQSVP